jgi:serine/threonine-protein kinase
LNQPPPSRLGPYEVGGKIAGGGMATVYIGRRDDKGKEKLVALKVIKDELAKEEAFVHMFLDEAKILSRLSHPNIIETLEYGVTDEHRFIAMELLLGRSLTDVWELLASKSDRVPVALGAWICARVAGGLEHAHSLRDEEGQGLSIIHRDVNPSNIFLTFDGRVKLIDFGLARSKDRRAKTGDGIVKGKVPYLSPEQIQQEHVDGRSDLYSLGTTLWELGSGKRLFKRETDIGTIEAIRAAVVPDFRKEAPDYPDALWEIVKRSLAPKPEDRFASAGHMEEALNEYLQSTGESLSAGTVTTFLADLFAGDEARQKEWLRLAKARPVRGRTLPPPIALPLPEVKLGAPSLPTAPPPPLPSIPPKRSKAPSKAPPAKASTKPPEAAPSRPHLELVQGEDTGQHEKPAFAAGGARALVATDTDAEAQRHIWMLAGAGLVVILLALLLLSR